MKHVAQPHLCGALTGMIRLMVRLVPMVAVSAVLVGAASAQHVITTTPGAGGSIFPAGPITVPDGSKPIFFVIPNTGFSIQDVKVNNVSVGKDPQVHPGPVTAPVTITATFIKSPTINATAAGSGTITPSGNDFVGYGGSRTFQMQAGLGSMLNALTVNGTPVVLPTPKPSQFSHTVSNITSNTTVKATFVADLNKVILTSTAGSGGTISPAGKVEATKGSSRSYTVTPLTGYYIADVKVDGKSIGKTGFPTLNNIQKNQTIVATFAKNPEIVATQSNGGTITPTGKSSVSYGGSRSYTITPLTGYEISHLMVNGKSQPASTSYTFFNVIANGTITAVFKALSTHVFVTSSAGAGGTITPLGKIGVAKGGSQSYTIIPAAGFRIQDVKVDGKSVGAVSFHTLTNVQKPQTIAASFIKNPVITAKQSPGGSISPAGNTSVALNGSQGYTITPATGFDLIHLLIDGKVVTDTDGSYTFANVTKNATIGAVFKQRTDHVALITTAGKGGTVTPTGKTLVQKGSNPEVTVTPAANHRVLNVKVGNNSLGSVTTTTITNIQADTTVAATFTPLPVITAKQAVGGTILPAGSKVVPFEGAQNYSISPSLGYKLDNLIIDGKAVADTDGSYTFSNVTANHSISAKFSLTTHVVTASSPPAGTISPSGTLNILHGKDQSFTITPPAGFKAGIRVNGVLKAQRAYKKSTQNRANNHSGAHIPRALDGIRGLSFDTPPMVMHDKSMTTQALPPRVKGKPVAVVKQGSAAVPIYRGLCRGMPRFTVAFYLNQQRRRLTFGSLDAAKEEARKAALNIQRGVSSDNDLRPQDREALRAVQHMLKPLGLPLVSVVEEYLQCRRKLGEVPLLMAVEDFVTRSRSYEAGITVPRVVDELLLLKKQDGVNEHYLKLLDGNLRQFAKSFPGEITKVTGAMIDGWLRRGAHSMVTRNNWLKRVKELFSFAKRRGYLPKGEATVAEALKRGKQADTDVGIFTPEQMEKLMRAASEDLIPILAIGGFAGLRGAEIARLNWSAVDLGRKIIELRAGQAKTASRRIVPITDNLAGWLAKIERNGPVVPDDGVFLKARRLAKSLGIPWPHNALRHSYISYRIAVVQSAAQVALEAGNSPAIIFKHYRELVTKESADQWFGIMP